MNLIRLLLQTSWLTVTLATVTGLISGASSTALIALINTTLTNTQPTALLVWSFVGLCLLLLISGITSQVLLARLAEGAIFELRMLLSRRILASPLHQLEEIGAARLLATLTDDIQSVASAFFGFPLLCTNLAIIVSCLIYLSWLSWSIFISMFGFLVVGIFSIQTLLIRGGRFLALAREEQDRLFKHFRAVTEGTKELKLHRQRQESFLFEELWSTAKASHHYNVTGRTIFAVASSWGLLYVFIPIGLLLFGFSRLLQIEPLILTGYVLVALYLVLPFQAILNALPVFSKASVALEKVESLGLALVELAEQPSPSPERAKFWQRLDLAGVTHAYRGEREDSGFILGPIDLTFLPGELIFIVGGNGSGKSTLAKLITGLYIPETGELRLDGVPITDQNREWYRQHFSVVFSDFFLFERLLGLNNHDIDTQTQEYLTQLQLEHKVQVTNGILSTTALSQGQRKRLALLTAYLEDRPIYLFDEWASDQDPVFKEIFYTQLLPDLKQRGKAVLVISHDDRYFHLADHIIKLDYGKVEYDRQSSKYS